MTEGAPDFWEIIQTEFPQHAGDRFLDEQNPQQSHKSPDSVDAETLKQRIIAASRDEAIADYFLNGTGSEESVLAQLQRQYDLSEQAANEAMYLGAGQLTEITEYGQEDEFYN